MRLVTVLIVLVVLSIGCSSGSGIDGLAANQIVVVGADGTVKLVDPDAGGEQLLGRSQARQRQPAWSPDGTRLAWTETDDDGTSRLAVAGEDGVAAFDTPFASFYNHWDPTSTRVASLGNLGTAVGLIVIDADDGELAETGQGQPLFLSWEDDGSRLALAGGSGFQVVSRDGEELLTKPVSRLFQAPIWIPGSSDVIAVVDRVTSAMVVRIDVETGVETDLLRVFGPVSMALDPSGSRLAVVHSAEAPGIVTVAFMAAQPPDLGTGLFVLDLESMDLMRVADAGRGALFWSPRGDRLLSLAPDAADPLNSLFRWQVHDLDGRLVAESDPVRSSRIMNASYLPFADQYVQSMTLWSPSGDAFVFAGEVDSTTGIWVQPADLFGGSEWLTEGAFASWSPRKAD